MPAPSPEKPAPTPAPAPAPAPAPQPAPHPTPTPTPTPAPQPGPHPAPQPSPKPGLSGAECAERIILVAAKKNVAASYGNSPSSGGYCAMGVRTSLQKSHVGGVADGLGNAIDYVRTLKPHGFVDSGARDPRRAPPGSVLVFSGPRTPAYLQNGNFGKPAGDWLGHVTIKGDDGRYYTDGRTREPALGWTNGVNEQHRRNMAAIFVPGSSLAGQYEGKCDSLRAEEQALDLSLAASEVSALAYETETQREQGRRLVAEGLAVLARASSPAAFTQALRLAREGAPFDDEGQLTLALADLVRADPSLRPELDAFALELPSAGGLEACKSKVMVASLERALCLRAAGAEGQDAPASCRPPLSLASCLALAK